MNVVIGNLPGNTGEQEVLEILKEHGVPVTEVTLTNEGNPEVAVAVVGLDTDHAGAAALVKMVHGKQWKGRTLRARAMALFTKQKIWVGRKSRAGYAGCDRFARNGLRSAAWVSRRRLATATPQKGNNIR